MLLQKYGRYTPDHDPFVGQKIITRMLQIAHKISSEKKKPCNNRALYGGASGTRTPDTRIMMP